MKANFRIVMAKEKSIPSLLGEERYAWALVAWMLGELPLHGKMDPFSWWLEAGASLELEEVLRPPVLTALAPPALGWASGGYRNKGCSGSCLKLRVGKPLGLGLQEMG